MLLWAWGPRGQVPPAPALDGSCPRPRCCVTCFEDRLSCRGCGSLPPRRGDPCSLSSGPSAGSLAALGLSVPFEPAPSGFGRVWNAPPGRGPETCLARRPWLTLTTATRLSRPPPLWAPLLRPSGCWNPFHPFPSTALPVVTTPQLPHRHGYAFSHLCKPRTKLIFHISDIFIT